MDDAPADDLLILGRDGVLEPVGRDPFEVPCHDSGMLEPLSQHAQPVPDRFPQGGLRVRRDRRAKRRRAACAAWPLSRGRAGAIYSVSSKSRFLSWAPRSLMIRMPLSLAAFQRRV